MRTSYSMSTKINVTSSTNNQGQQDINEVFKKNFNAYFQEIEKVMPQYLQAITKLQEEFLGAWKNTINSSIISQKDFAEKTDIETNIPQEAANIIQTIAEEYIKSKNIQNQTILSTLEMFGNNLKNNNNSFESVTEFNKQFLNFWADMYSKKQ